MVAASIALAIICLAAQHPAATTPSEAAKEMLRGDKVKFELLDSNGAEHKASLVRIDGRNAVLRSGGTDYTIPVDQLRRIERRGDRQWNGALIGFAVGVGVAAVIDWRTSASLLTGGRPPDDNSRAIAASLICTASGALGYAIDAAHGRKHTLFVGTMPATPAAHASALGVGLVGHAHDRGLQASYRLTFQAPRRLRTIASAS
jgi:hypothetical protein